MNSTAPARIDISDLKDRTRLALPFVEVAMRDGLTLKKMGRAFLCQCPFHTEKSGSFTIGGKSPDFAHCFGCGWSGDIFKFWSDRHGCDFVMSVTQLASLAGLVPRMEAVQWHKPKVKVPVLGKRLVGQESPVKPSLPPMRMLRAYEIEQLATGRGLSVAAVQEAANRRWIGACSWPQFEKQGQWWCPKETHASWCITDSTRNTAEFRRLDGKKYVRRDGGEIKAWSTRGKNWPIGAAEMGDKAWVLMVEGGPDVLAAFHFLHGYNMLRHVAVVGMLGASNAIREEALDLFTGKRVRIMVDADTPKDDENPLKRKLPGMEAAGRWQAQLTAYGATVETFNVGPIYHGADVTAWGKGELRAAEIRIEHPGFVRADGEPVKDVNDLALCNAEVIDSEEVRDAFCEWKEGFGG